MFSLAEGSLESGPDICSRTIPQSSADRQSGPILSKDQLNAIAPYLLTLPYVGRKPETPQLLAGDNIEPHVSEPIENGTSPVPTADPEPLDEPPAHVFLSHGLLQGPVSEAFGCL